jgi:hypothetical protein
LEKNGLSYPGLQQVILEPFFSYVSTPDPNAEIGNNFAFKVGFLPEGARFQPYFKGGAGLIYLTRHFRYQATQFNFTEFGSVGFHFFISKKSALTAEYGYRHCSNANIKEPNAGITGYITTLGYSYFF